MKNQKNSRKSKKEGHPAGKREKRRKNRENAGRRGLWQNPGKREKKELKYRNFVKVRVRMGNL